jgi:acyl carrier protein
MNPKEIYSIIASVLKISIDDVNDELSVGDIPEWDSLAHMQLIEAFEEASGATLDIEKIIEIEDVQDLLEAFQKSD